MIESQTSLALQCRPREPYSDASATLWVGLDVAGHHHITTTTTSNKYRGLQNAQMGVGVLIALPGTLALMLIAKNLGCIDVSTAELRKGDPRHIQ